MLIDILCTDGSPIGVTLKDLWGEGNRGVGIGGAEYFLLTLCEAWHNNGHTVRLYNNPTGIGSPFEQLPVGAFDPNANRDVLITFRTPNPKALVAKGLKVWLSCDQYTSEPFSPFAPHMQKIVVISEFHKKYFESTYGIHNSIVIDIPVRFQDLNLDIPKVPKKCIFTSIPDRGLMELYRIWSATISKRVPDATLTITSDYRLWGVDERNAPHRVRWMYEPNVTFLGAIPRKQLIEEQLSSQLLVYPSTYDELFCIAVSEAQACGVYPITSNTGALSTTNMGTIVPTSAVNYHATFASTVVDYLNNPELPKLQQEVRQKAIERFSIEKIMKEWDEKIFA